MLKRLLSQRWASFESDLSAPKGSEYPGVYLLAYTSRNIAAKRVQLADIFYVGMSNSLGGVRQRLKQFRNGIEKNTSHSAGRRFFSEYSNGVAFSKRRGGSRKKLYFAFVSVRCTVEKARRTPADLRTMGRIAKLEYDVIAHLKEKLGEEPKLNKK